MDSFSLNRKAGKRDNRMFPSIRFYRTMKSSQMSPFPKTEFPFDSTLWIRSNPLRPESSSDYNSFSFDFMISLNSVALYSFEKCCNIVTASVLRPFNFFPMWRGERKKNKTICTAFFKYFLVLWVVAIHELVNRFWIEFSTLFSELYSILSSFNQIPSNPWRPDDLMKLLWADVLTDSWWN